MKYTIAYHCKKYHVYKNTQHKMIGKKIIELSFICKTEIDMVLYIILKFVLTLYCLDFNHI